MFLDVLGTCSIDYCSLSDPVELRDLFRLNRFALALAFYIQLAFKLLQLLRLSGFYLCGRSMAWSGRLDFQRTEVEFSAVALACAYSPWSLQKKGILVMVYQCSSYFVVFVSIFSFFDDARCRYAWRMWRTCISRGSLSFATLANSAGQRYRWIGYSILVFEAGSFDGGNLFGRGGRGRICVVVRQLGHVSMDNATKTWKFIFQAVQCFLIWSFPWQRTGCDDSS